MSEPNSAPRTNAAPDRERWAVVTGANTGIGRKVAIDLAHRGVRVILAGRSRERTREALTEAREAAGAADRVRFVRLDLASLDSVRRAAEEIRAETPRLDLLVNNAGVGGQRGITEDGFEIHFGINHLGHFLLTRQLLDRLSGSDSARIVVVASNAHYRAPGIDFGAVRRPTRSLTGLREYQVSKLANVLFVLELRRRLEGSSIAPVAVHPGTVATDIWRRIPWPIRSLVTRSMRSVPEGAEPVLRAAVDASPPEEGYLDRDQPRRPSAPALDRALGARLWETSEAWTR